jgi:hypothetical protein
MIRKKKSVNEPLKRSPKMNDVYIGKGKLAGRGVYAGRNFKKGEVVKYYNLKTLTRADFDALPKSERMFVHSFWGEMYLFPEPSRYTNHSTNPNTKSDLKRMCDIAIKPIKKDEMITINASIEVQNELETFIEVLEKPHRVTAFQRLHGGYRNAIVAYLVGGKKKQLRLKRTDGNWKIIE